jgi:AmmeMemoRadiSam system protein A
MGMTKQVQKTLLVLAREAIVGTLAHAAQPVYEQLKREKKSPYTQELGAFVTLHTQEGELRGCIGNLWGVSPLYQMIPDLARQAAFSDPRFRPIREEELPSLVLEISILSKMRVLQDWHDIRLGSDGVLLTYHYHRAVFLPQVATEQGWDLETMLRQLCRKAGLPDLAYTDELCRFEVFQAEVFDETSV